MGLFNKIKQGLSKTRKAVIGQIDTMLSSFSKIDDELFEELEELLVMGDVGVPTAEKICNELRDIVKKNNVTDPAAIKFLLRDTITKMLEGGEQLNISTFPAIILVIGVNGVGKTTTIGKMAKLLTDEGNNVLLAAADTFRAAAIDQLDIWAQRSGAQIIKQKEGSDPAAVVYDAIAAAKARDIDVIICDTAGRLHNKKHLMDELAKINRVIDRELPDSAKENLLVLDATTGQNAVNQAEQFREATGITGIVLTKLDGTAKGGVVLAIKDGLGIPVKYIGVGEQVDDLQPFTILWESRLFPPRRRAWCSTRWTKREPPSRKTPLSRRTPRLKKQVCPPSPTIRVSAWTRWAADRESFRRATVPSFASPTRTGLSAFSMKWKAFPRDSAARTTPAPSAAFCPTAAKSR